MGILHPALTLTDCPDLMVIDDSVPALGQTWFVAMVPNDPGIRKDCFQVKSNLLTDFRFTTHMNIMILN